MKITFLVQDLMGGGVQYATASMVRAFYEHGHEVELLISRYHETLLKQGKKPFEVPSGVKTIVMPSERSSRNILYLRRYMKKTDSQYIIAESGLYSDALRIAAIGLWKHPRLIQVWHGDTPSMDIPFFEAIKRKIRYGFKYRKFFALYTVNSMIGQAVLRITSALKPERVVTVWNPVVDDVLWRKLKSPTTHPWLLNKQCPTFIAAGACDPNKGHMFVIKSIEKASKVRKMRLVIFGTGELENEFKKYVKEHNLEEVVSFAGFCDNIPAEMKSADGFVLGTHVESFAIVLAEAMACGIPCVSTDAPWGPREVLDNGKYGRLVPVEDVEAMAAALVDLAAGRIPVAPPEAWQRYTIDKIFERYCKVMGVIR